MDTYSHVLPGLDERAATTVAQLILEGDDSVSASVDKALTNGTWSPVDPRGPAMALANSRRECALHTGLNGPSFPKAFAPNGLSRLS